MQPRPKLIKRGSNFNFRCTLENAADAASCLACSGSKADSIKRRGRYAFETIMKFLEAFFFLSLTSTNDYLALLQNEEQVKRMDLRNVHAQE